LQSMAATSKVRRAVPCMLDYPERFFAAVMFAADTSKHKVEVTDENRLLLYALFQQVAEPPDHSAVQHTPATWPNLASVACACAHCPAQPSPGGVSGAIELHVQGAARESNPTHCQVPGLEFMPRATLVGAQSRSWGTSLPITHTHTHTHTHHCPPWWETHS
jgi:hypothetical protein